MNQSARRWLFFLATGATIAAAPLPRADLAAEGVDPAGVWAFLAAVESQRLGLHSCMLMRHGRVVAEAWWKPGAPALVHPLYSLTKNFTATAVGIAVDEGKLRLDDRVADWLASELPGEVSANLAAMRVRDLLTMTAGHERDPIPAITPLPADGNWVRTVLAQPVKISPGTHFAYSIAAAAPAVRRCAAGDGADAARLPEDAAVRSARHQRRSVGNLSGWPEHRRLGIAVEDGGHCEIRSAFISRRENGKDGRLCLRNGSRRHAARKVERSL